MGKVLIVMIFKLIGPPSYLGILIEWILVISIPSIFYTLMFTLLAKRNRNIIWIHMLKTPFFFALSISFFYVIGIKIMLNNIEISNITSTLLGLGVFYVGLIGTILGYTRRYAINQRHYVFLFFIFISIIAINLTVGFKKTCRQNTDSFYGSEFNSESWQLNQNRRIRYEMTGDLTKRYLSNGVPIEFVDSILGKPDRREVITKEELVAIRLFNKDLTPSDSYDLRYFYDIGKDCKFSDDKRRYLELRFYNDSITLIKVE